MSAASVFRRGPTKRQLRAALIFWVDRARRFEEEVPEAKAYKKARGVGSAQYALGRRVFEESLPSVEDVQGILRGDDRG